MNRDFAKKAILELVKEGKAISRRQIKDKTGLQLSTITSLVEELEMEGWVKEDGKVKTSHRGRPPNLIRLNSEACFSLGLEFTPHHIFSSAINLNKETVIKGEERILSEGEEPERKIIVTRLVRAAKKLVADLPYPKEKILGLGLAVPGIIDSKEGVSLYCSLFRNWHNVPLKRILQRELNIPVELIRDIKAETLAEMEMGSGRGHSNFIFFGFGEGISCGIVSEGKIIGGCSGMAGELGHTHIPGNKAVCGCGGFGCLEAVTAFPAIAARVKESLSQNAISLIPEFLKPGEAVSAHTVFEAAKRGDKLSLRVLDDIVFYLSIGIANTINLLNPQLVVFSQNLALAGEVFLRSLEDAIRKYLLPSQVSLTFTLSKLGKEAGALGAAYFALDKFFFSFSRGEQL